MVILLESLNLNFSQQHRKAVKSESETGCRKPLSGLQLKTVEQQLFQGRFLRTPEVIGYYRDGFAAMGTVKYPAVRHETASQRRRKWTSVLWGTRRQRSFGFYGIILLDFPFPLNSTKHF